MTNQSPLQKQALKGPLFSQGVIQPKNGVFKKAPLVFALNLTALIDAFSILVIFLLSNYSGDAQNINLKKDMILPAATQSEIMTMGTVVRVDRNQYYIDEKAVSYKNLVSELIQVKKSKKDETESIQNSLIIQADRQLDFATLSPVIRAGGQAGFNHYRFAVLPKSAASKYAER